jgi:hypothetical protein
MLAFKLTLSTQGLTWRSVPAYSFKQIICGLISFNHHFKSFIKYIIWEDYSLKSAIRILGLHFVQLNLLIFRLKPHVFFNLVRNRLIDFCTDSSFKYVGLRAFKFLITSAVKIF